MRSSLARCAAVMLVGLSPRAGAGEPLHARLSHASGEQLAGLAKELKARVNRTAVPVIEGRTVTFVLDDAKAETVSVAGDWTGWRPVTMQKLGATGLWWRSETFPAGTRMEYKLVGSGGMVVDPANPSRVSNGLGGENSVFQFQDYRPETRTTPVKAEQRGRADSFSVTSRVLGNTRTVQVYLPHAYGLQPERRFPVLYLHDGEDYRLRVHAPELLDHLVAEGKVAPVILVMIPPVDRMAEYWRKGRDYEKFLAEEVVQRIDEKYRTVHAPAGRASGGASLGGYISLRLAEWRPDLFGAVLSQSGAFQVDDTAILRDLAGKKLAARVSLDYGLYESTLTEANRKIVEQMRKDGWILRDAVKPTAHNWTAWRDRFAQAVEWLFPRKRTTADEHSTGKASVLRAAGPLCARCP